MGFVILLFSSCKKEEFSDIQADFFTKFYGGSGEDGAGELIQTSDDGYIFVGTKDLVNSTDIVVVKTDMYGNPVWEKTYGDSLNNIGNSIKATADGSYIILGTTYIDLNQTDMHLLKIDSKGNVIFENLIGSNYSETGNSVIETSEGEFVLVGTKQNDPDAANSSLDICMVKANAQGDSIWTRIVGGTADETATGIIQNFDGNYVIIGSSESFAEVGQAKSNIFIVETNQNGIPITLMSYGGQENDHGSSVIQLDDGSYILVGTTESFGSGGKDVFVAKTAVGDIRTKEWETTFGGEKNDLGAHICLLKDANYAIIGTTESFGNGDRDMYLVKFDGIGNEIFYRTFGSTGYDQGKYLIQTSDEGIGILGLTGFENNSMICINKTNADGELK